MKEFYSNYEMKKTTVSANIGQLFLFPLFAKGHRHIVSKRNICYSGQGKRSFLDVYSKYCFGGKKPLFIYIHGGGWISGLRETRAFYCLNWVEKGYVAANIGYDYGAWARHPEHLRQIFKGIEYVLAHSEEFGIDSSRIVISGDSAGGHLAAFVAAIATHRDLYERFGISFKFKETFKPGACVLISGIYDPERSLSTGFGNIEIFTYALCRETAATLAKKDAEATRSELAPEYYADRSFPPSFIIGSEKDLLLPESESLYKKLDSIGVPAEFYLCRGLHGVHAGGLACDRFSVGKECVGRAQAFVERIL